MTPVVHLQYGVLHRHALHAVFQFFVEHHARIVQILVVHPYRQYEMAEQQLRHFASPRHLLLRHEARAHIVEEELGGVVRHVGERHIPVEKFQSRVLRGGDVLQLRGLARAQGMHKVGTVALLCLHCQRISCMGESCGRSAAGEEQCRNDSLFHNSEYYITKVVLLCFPTKKAQPFILLSPYSARFAKKNRRKALNVNKISYICKK